MRQMSDNQIQLDAGFPTPWFDSPDDVMTESDSYGFCSECNVVTDEETCEDCQSRESKQKTTPNTFGAACYEQNSITELEQALTEKPDARDMGTWGISETEWRAQISDALAGKRADQSKEGTR